MTFTVNAFEFEEQENFDMFNDLTLNPRDDIMPNLVYEAKLCDNSYHGMQYYFPPTVTKYNDVEFDTLFSYSNFLIPTLIMTLTSENNILDVHPLATSYGAQGDYVVRYSKQYYNYDNMSYGEQTYTNPEDFSGLCNVHYNNATQANNAVYLDFNFTYQDFGRPFYINTNIPILVVDDQFDRNNQATRDYLNHLMTLDDYVASDEHILGILNGKQPEIKPEITYELTCIASQYTVDEYGELTKTSAPTLYRGFRIKSRNPVSLYKKEGIVDGNLEYGINFEDATVCYYSTGDPTFSTWQMMTGSPTSLPFNFVWRYHEDETGTFYCADSIKSTYVNIPTWNNKEDSDAYNDGEKDISEAENFNEISGQYEIHNPTGEQDDGTVFGQNLTEQFFTRCYLCNVSNLREISNALFDYDVTTLSGIWNDIKKGLEMYGSNPMEVVQGLRFYPFDISEIFSDTSSDPYIYFGAYRLDLNNGNVLKVYHPNGYKTLGTVHLYRTFKDWRDFEPYTKLSIYLPYIGRYPLQASRYYDKDIEVRYYVDIRTGICCACLIGDGILLDWFDGQIGTEMPITLTDYSSYAQTQINTILRNATMGAAAEGTIIGTGVKETKRAMQLAKGAEEARETPLKSSLAAQTATVGAVGATVGGYAAAGGLVAAGMGIKTAYDLMKTGTSAFTTTKGSSSSLINSFLPQYPTFMFEIVDIDESPFLNELYGRPTNASGRIGDFSGYLEAEDVMLICPIATDTERQEIIDLVRSGIYI